MGATELEVNRHLNPGFNGEAGDSRGSPGLNVSFLEPKDTRFGVGFKGKPKEATPIWRAPIFQDTHLTSNPAQRTSSAQWEVP